MADPTGFIVPTPEDFDVFISMDDSVDATDWSSDQKLWLLRSAADLMLLATDMANGAPVPDSNSPLGRLINNGIKDMAYYLGSTFDDRSAQQYSPFTSEKIGEYSYSKALKSVVDKKDTGVSFFDSAVRYYQSWQPNSSTSGQFAVSTEQVFKSGFCEYEEQLRRDSRWDGIR